MKVDVQTIKVFERQARRLMKKHPSLKGEIQTLVEKLEGNPTCGVSIGRQCYKIRLAIASKGRGKAGGARVITYFISDEFIVYLLSIYDESERGTITDSELPNCWTLSPIYENQKEPELSYPAVPKKLTNQALHHYLPFLSMSET